ncbi:hypothetical protein AJ78_05034 [Emergomyces pasteurianus Ep9510]|uniref:Alpha/beta hydrolase fold-3 domain-containing protein n=1 Tax=Emergomyces pasteurianus Ep9510 TaxID=1447872 RepID=A0A1J9QHF7_9EURO|nr:hypothetical protein AJ78_05034 [Emergomyces pasteurianus Ep9510]
MPFNALTVGAAVTPTVILTLLSHYRNRKAHRSKPTARISYHEGLRIIRQFLTYSSLHTVESLQTFTSQWVPNPSWVKVDSVIVPQDHLDSAADLLIIQLGPEGLSQVGGNKWWKWRGKRPSLQGEWVEMQRDFVDRHRQDVRSNRVMLYLHGGAYYFGSLNSHRYQIQRHARKLKARVFARVTLPTIFPFPCALQDCLAAYLYLLSIHKPSEIIIGGDSAGAGLVLSILVTLRDQRMPLPAGAVLISPWVDLTHSFPSVSDDGGGDYIPSYGFMHRPSKSWPPPSSDEIDAIANAGEAARSNGNLRASGPFQGRSKDAKATGRRSTGQTPSIKETSVGRRSHSSSISEPYIMFHNRSRTLEIEIDGQLVELKDQIHMYTTNELLSHPLVSPVLQPSLGGLPPMLVLTGGAELLRDEQIYLAHKAADPTYYLPSEEYLDRHDPGRRTINRYPPTFVQLQVWDDLCHVTPTLSFTRPAKYMFRSIAHFGAWALARAQRIGIDIPSHVSETSSSDDVGNLHASVHKETKPSPYSGFTTIGKAGDPLPLFEDYMIRQRVDSEGNIYPLAARSQLTALQILPEEIGVPKPGPVRKWLQAKEAWDIKFSKQKSAVQQKRLEEIRQGIGLFRHGEYPPPSSLASRKDISVPYEEGEQKKSHGMWLWSLMASKHDLEALERENALEEKDIKVGPQSNFPSKIKSPTRIHSLRKKILPRAKRKKGHSRHPQTVSDLGQASESIPVLVPPPRSAKRNDPNIPVASFDEPTSGPPSILPVQEFQPGFSDPRLLYHSGDIRRRSSEYTDDASVRSIKDAPGVISPLFSGSKSDTEFKTPPRQRTPNISATPTSPAPKQNGRQSGINGLAHGKENDDTRAIDDQLFATQEVGEDHDVSDLPGVKLFGRNVGMSKYDFESSE